MEGISTEELRKKQERFRRLVKEKEETHKIRELFLKQVISNTRKHVEATRPKHIKPKTWEEKQREEARPKSPKNYDFIRVLEMMK